METDGKTDLEVIYWVTKYLLMCNDKPFSQLGFMSEKMRALAESQDKIGWRNFTEGCISIHFYNIQHFHLLMSISYLNGLDWTKQFISTILQITHSQWIYQNISLHDKRQGYLRNKRLEELSRRSRSFRSSAPTRYQRVADSYSRSTLQS
jgi:hypothetical protein